MEVQKEELANSHESSKTPTAGYLIPENAFYKIKALNAQLRLMSELAQRKNDDVIVITASALEDTLLLIESTLNSALDEAKFLSHQ